MGTSFKKRDTIIIKMIGECRYEKMFICLVGMVMAISLAGCGGQSDAQNGGSAPDSSYTSAVQVLETVIDTYTEEQKFPIGGGDSEI